MSSVVMKMDNEYRFNSQKNNNDKILKINSLFIVSPLTYIHIYIYIYVIECFQLEHFCTD